jgi:hydroxymethylpyrimidine/phosphomethylpyrimidine kinase
LTVQNTQRVDAVETIEPRLVRAQIEAVVSDIPPQAAKTGALGTGAIIEVVAACARRFAFPLVVDPVMISKHGARLMAGDAQEVLIRRLLSVTFLVTPNLPEAAVLSGIEATDPESMGRAARLIAELGPKAVLVKGGHLAGEAVDVLYHQDRVRTFSAPRIETSNTHGTGCTYSAAITAELAKGCDLEAAVNAAKRYISHAIAANPGLGRGRGPVDHHAGL